MNIKGLSEVENHQDAGKHSGLEADLPGAIHIKLEQAPEETKQRWVGRMCQSKKSGRKTGTRHTNA